VGFAETGACGGSRSLKIEKGQGGRRAANEGHMPRRVPAFSGPAAVDLADYRKAVHERLMRTGLFHCVRQEDFGPA
jgi:hypothetical protein